MPSGHVSRFIVTLVQETLDLGAIIGSYRASWGSRRSIRGMMTALLLQGLSAAVLVASDSPSLRGAGRLHDACCGRPPDFRTIWEFRRRHEKALSGLFAGAEGGGKGGSGEAGSRGAGRHEDPGERLRHKAMSYERMKKREAELATEVDRWLKAADAADREEDASTAATSCRHGWPTSRSGWRRSARQRRNSRRRRRRLPKKKGGTVREPRSLHRRRNRHPRRNATSPTPRAAS